MRKLTTLAFLPFLLKGGETLRTVDEVVAKMLAADSERQASLQGYTVSRHYTLENQNRHKHAEMLVRMTCQQDGSKQFKIVSSDGWGIAQKHVFPKLLEAETDAARPGARDRSRITPENYTFRMIGLETVRNRLAYALEIEPKTPNKYLAKGRIWVDAEEFAIVRVEGEPAKNPSFWTKKVHFVHEYNKTGLFWFPVSDRSITDARILGSTEMTIEYFDYVAPNGLESAALR
jgi:outer membrane lipoprotein-sorting protein